MKTITINDKTYAVISSSSFPVINDLADDYISNNRESDDIFVSVDTETGMQYLTQRDADGRIDLIEIDDSDYILDCNLYDVLFPAPAFIYLTDSEIEWSEGYPAFRGNAPIVSDDLSGTVGDFSCKPHGFGFLYASGRTSTAAYYICGCRYIYAHGDGQDYTEEYF